MEKPLVFVTRTIHPPALERLSTFANVEVWQSPAPPPREILLNRIEMVDGILTLLTESIDQEVIEAAGKNLKVISQMAVGFDNINITLATRKGIPVGNTPGILSETTADFTWALLMAAARRVSEANREVHQGIWRPWGPDVLTGMDVFNANLGIIGFGRIGQAVARRAMGFSMQVMYYDLKRFPEAEIDCHAQYAPLDMVLSQSDYITLHINLNTQSHHLIGMDQFKLMKPSAIFINTSRGGVVDSDALYLALKEKWITSAAIDVFESEPIPPDHPILDLDNLIITPHIASASKQTRARMAEMAVDNLIAGITGKPLPHCVNPEVYQA